MRMSAVAVDVASAFLVVWLAATILLRQQRSELRRALLLTHGAVLLFICGDLGTQLADDLFVESLSITILYGGTMSLPYCLLSLALAFAASHDRRPGWLPASTVSAAVRSRVLLLALRRDEPLARTIPDAGPGGQERTSLALVGREHGQLLRRMRAFRGLCLGGQPTRRARGRENPGRRPVRRHGHPDRGELRLQPDELVLVDRPERGSNEQRRAWVSE